MPSWNRKSSYRGGGVGTVTGATVVAASAGGGDAGGGNGGATVCCEGGGVAPWPSSSWLAIPSGERAGGTQLVVGQQSTPIRNAAGWGQKLRAAVYTVQHTTQISPAFPNTPTAKATKHLQPATLLRQPLMFRRSAGFLPRDSRSHSAVVPGRAYCPCTVLRLPAIVCKRGRRNSIAQAGSHRAATEQQQKRSRSAARAKLELQGQSLVMICRRRHNFWFETDRDTQPVLRRRDCTQCTSIPQLCTCETRWRVSQPCALMQPPKA